MQNSLGLRKLVDLERNLLEQLKQEIHYPVYERMPVDTEGSLPYVVLGKLSAFTDASKTTNGDVVTQVVNIYSNADDKQECLRIGEKVEHALTQRGFAINQVGVWDIFVRRIEVEEIESTLRMKLNVIIKIDWRDE